jgi:radical SAM protein with 4Fe4S-binding SPASM domain
MDREILFKYLEEARQLGVDAIAFSGGEPLVYPYLEEAIAYGSRLGLNMIMATSGFGMTESLLKALVNKGLRQLYISLNGSNERIHSLSRDGFEEAIKLLELCRKQGVKVVVNWVARKDNYRDFPQLLKVLEPYCVTQVAVIMLKPDANYQLEEGILGQDYRHFKLILKEALEKSIVPIRIESCYSYLKQDLFGDQRHPKEKLGCQSAKSIMAINVDGGLMPCRHLPMESLETSIKKFWHENETVNQLRKMNLLIKDPCGGCNLKDGCQPCRSLAYKLEGDLAAGFKACPLPICKKIKFDWMDKTM